MSTILVVDDMALCREPIAEALRCHGHEVTCAASGTEALEVLRDQKPDLVLLDVSMPPPDGLAVLEIMRRNPNLQGIPVILLTDRAEKETVARAAKCGAQGYLLKSNFSLEVLLERVKACTTQANPEAVGASHGAKGRTAGTPSKPRTATGAAASAPPARPAASPCPSTPTPGIRSAAESAKLLQGYEPVITKAKLTKLVSTGLKLRPLAATVHNVMAVTGSNGCCANDVAKAVASDQALCIRLLKLANSSAYSRGRPADSVQTAVQRIGVQEVRKLVMTLGVFEQYATNQPSRIDIRLFWEHSLACGLIAAALARECRFHGVDDCFLWGTVHDIGRVILLDHVPEEYNQVCDVADELELPLEIVEPKLLLLDHCQILHRALEHWQFPNAFIVPVVNHHGPVPRLQRLGPEHTQGAMIVALANRMAHALLLGCSGNETIFPLDELVDALGVSTSAIEKIAATVPDETRDLKFTMLAHSVGETWPDYGSQLRERFETTLHPLCVSSEPATDAFQLFLDRAGEPGDSEPPNLGVIYLREAREANALFAEWEASETKAGAAHLPLIVVCGRKAGKLGDVPWRNRDHLVIHAPITIPFFLKAAEHMLTQVAAC